VNDLQHAVRDILKQACTQLTNSSTPRLDIELLLGFALKVGRSFFYTHADYHLTETEWINFSQLLTRRQQGEPVAYILGRREFWSLELQVSQATLIPRPETELLVELALSKIPKQHPVRIADLGTGSGAIALAIARERPLAQIYALDISLEALKLAKLNAEQLGLTNIQFLAGDWLASLVEGEFDVIVSNPPYLAADDPHLAQGDIRFEPQNALVAGIDGLEAYRKLIPEAKRVLKPDGWILLEHGWTQADAVLALLKAANFTKLDKQCDLNQLERVSLGQNC